MAKSVSVVTRKKPSCLSILLLIVFNFTPTKLPSSTPAPDLNDARQDNNQIESNNGALNEVALISLQGNAEQVGKKFGTQFRERICEETANWWKKVQDQGYSRKKVLESVLLKAQTLETYAPHILQEILVTAQLCDVSYEDLLAVNLFSDPQANEGEGCTSWVACGSATETGATLLHKNRDTGRGTQAIYRVEEVGKNAYIAVGTLSTSSVSAGINEHGLAVASNSVFTLDVDLSGVSNTVLNRMILEDCNSVDDVFDYLNSINLEGGTIEFVADKDKAAIIELTASTRGVQNVSENFGVRANTFVILGGDTTPDSQDRFDAANNFLTSHNESITIEACNELSRHHKILTDGSASLNDGSICNRPKDGLTGTSSCLGVTFEINETYPGYLSTMWVAIGLPDSSIYAPFHIGSTSISTAFGNGTIWDIAEKIRYNNLGPYSGWTPDFLDWEREFIVKAKTKENEAGTFLLSSDMINAQYQLTNFDSNTTNWICEKLSNISETGFWKDSFYDGTGIFASNNVKRENGNITLLGSYLSGTLASSIITQKDGWAGAIFHATHALPAGTNILYKLVSATSGEQLCQITPEQAAMGYVLSTYVNVEQIKIIAELSSSVIGTTPVILDWSIVGLISPKPSWFWTYGIWYLVGGVLIIGLISVCSYRRRNSRHSRKAHKGISTENIRM